jgi:hypothetical protein
MNPLEESSEWTEKAKKIFGEPYEEVDFYACHSLHKSGLPVEEKIAKFLYRTDSASLQTYINECKTNNQVIFKNCLIECYEFQKITRELGNEAQKINFYGCKFITDESRARYINSSNHICITGFQFRDCYFSSAKPIQLCFSSLENSVSKSASTGTSLSLHELMVPSEPSAIRMCVFEQFSALMPIRIVNCRIDGLNINSSRDDLGNFIESSVFNNLIAQTNDLMIRDCRIGKLTFAGSQFTKRAIFEGVNFEKATLVSISKNNIPLFASRNVHFENVNFNDKSSSEALGAFRALKKACEDAGYEHGVILFHSLELETFFNSQLKGRLFTKDFPEYVASHLNKVFTDYGFNTLKPLLVVIFLFIIGIVMNVSVLNTTNGVDLIKNSVTCSFRNSIGPMIFALQNSGKDLCFDYMRTSQHQVFHFIQIVLTTTLWFLLILMIRRRFKI